MKFLNVLGCVALNKSIDKDLAEVNIMAKYLDKTLSEWEDLTERWHTDTTIKCTLQEYLELDDIEYLKFAHGIDDKKISDEEVLKKSAEITKEVVTELAIKPALEKVARRIKR